MRQQVAYLEYVLRHKWFVMLACIRLGVPLCQAITHDWTKFTKTEWGPYAKHFFNEDGSKRTVRDASGAYDPNAQPSDFKGAWLSHQRNKHHWQAWVSIGDGGSLSALPMPIKYVREMVADWSGAGRAQGGSGNPCSWYEANRPSMVLAIETQVKINKTLPILQSLQPEVRVGN